MARTTNGTAEERWRDRFRRWHGSGLSIREFCFREGVSEVSFYQWRKGLLCMNDRQFDWQRQRVRYAERRGAERDRNQRNPQLGQNSCKRKTATGVLLGSLALGSECDRQCQEWPRINHRPDPNQDEDTFFGRTSSGVLQGGN
jgi:hypothetical protein